MTAARKSTTRRPASTAKPRGNSDTRDAILRAAEQAKEDGLRSEQAQHGVKMIEATDLTQLVQDMPDNFVQCRSFGHGKALANYKKEQRVISFTLYCPSCKFARHIVMDRYGNIIEEKPDWPEGYLLPKGSGRIGADTKGVVRLETITRAFGTDTSAPKRRKARSR